MSNAANNNPACVGCLGTRLTEFFHCTNSPANCGSISSDESVAARAGTGEITLVYCLDCGLVHNRTFDVAKIDFEPGYEVGLTHSKTFMDFQTGVVKRLSADYELKQKNILEIGCGDGQFLKRICHYGDNCGVGIDPTVPETGSFELEPGSVRFIRDFFGKQHADEIGDFVCSLSMFEDIPQPLRFLQMLRQTIAQRRPAIYFEVFNGFRSIESEEIWSIHYEQCNYFSLPTLVDLFRRTGFNVTNSGLCYQQGQYLFVEAVPNPDFNVDKKGKTANSTTTNGQVPQAVSNFSKMYLDRTQYWQQKLSQMKQSGKRVVLWGSGGKGISFLNAVEATDEIQFVVDINPNRQNRCIPGTAQKIIAPQRLTEFQPDLIILTNPIYEMEIRGQVAELNLECDFEFV